MDSTHKTDTIAMLTVLVREAPIQPISPRRREAIRKLVALGYAELCAPTVRNTYRATAAGVAFLESCAEIIEEFLEKPEPKRVDERVWHHLSSPGEVWCMANYANLCSTNIEEHVTCGPCRSMFLEASLRRLNAGDAG